MKKKMMKQVKSREDEQGMELERASYQSSEVGRTPVLPRGIDRSPKQLQVERSPKPPEFEISESERGLTARKKKKSRVKKAPAPGQLEENNVRFKKDASPVQKGQKKKRRKKKPKDSDTMVSLLSLGGGGKLDRGNSAGSGLGSGIGAGRKSRRQRSTYASGFSDTMVSSEYSLDSGRTGSDSRRTSARVWKQDDEVKALKHRSMTPAGSRISEKSLEKSSLDFTVGSLQTGSDSRQTEPRKWKKKREQKTLKHRSMTPAGSRMSSKGKYSTGSSAGSGSSTLTVIRGASNRFISQWRRAASSLAKTRPRRKGTIPERRNHTVLVGVRPIGIGGFATVFPGTKWPLVRIRENAFELAVKICELDPDAVKVSEEDAQGMSLGELGFVQQQSVSKLEELQNEVRILDSLDTTPGRR